MKGIGCDLCAIDRLKKPLQNPRFQSRVYTVLEQGEINAKGAATAAGYWAAKEACAKALGTGFCGIQFTEIEIRKDKYGAPQLQLYGNALARMQALGASAARISISHDAGLALAFCILE